MAQTQDRLLPAGRSCFSIFILTFTSVFTFIAIGIFGLCSHKLKHCVCWPRLHTHLLRLDSIKHKRSRAEAPLGEFNPRTDTMDWAILQEEVRGLIPPRELEPSSCWVGVLHHDKDPQKRLTQDDFLWMIGRGVSLLFLYSSFRADSDLPAENKSPENTRQLREAVQYYRLPHPVQKRCSRVSQHDQHVSRP
jgi:hypothetical protein